MKFKRILIVSNRLPVKVERRKSDLKFLPATGGLATGLKSFYKKHPCLWIGWPGLALKENEKTEIESKLESQFKCQPVFLSEQQVNLFYRGFCNQTIWPLFHYFPQYVNYSEELWQSYQEINQLYYQNIKKIIRPKDLIWIHDYHLMLLPRLIRKAHPKAKIGFFLHIPFPSFELFRLLPWRKEILKGILGADLIGFHTKDYCQHFLTSVGNLLNLQRKIKVKAFPMGIDFQGFAKAVTGSEVKTELRRLRKKIGQRKVILSVDRLDFTKGILERLRGFELFLKKYPKWQGKVILVLIEAPSRAKVPQYRALREEVDELVGRINSEYRIFGWNPVWYFYRSIPFASLIARYFVSDCALITPLRDGMNLVAKEYLATKTDNLGVLILSEIAGAAKELGEAILVNPNDSQQIAKALNKALTMRKSEKISRCQPMRERLKKFNVNFWARQFINELAR